MPQTSVHCVSQQLACCQVSHTHLRTPSSQCFSRTSCTHTESHAFEQQSGKSAQMHVSTAMSAQPPVLWVAQQAPFSIVPPSSVGVGSGRQCLAWHFCSAVVWQKVVHSPEQQSACCHCVQTHA
jgi:hypothetical protein